jgi:hypothetical protein
MPEARPICYISVMSGYDDFTGISLEQSEDRTRRWAAILVRAALAVFVVGAVLAAVLWTVSADVGALTLSIGFAGLAGLMVLRQALLAERR